MVWEYPVHARGIMSDGTYPIDMKVEHVGSCLEVLKNKALFESKVRDKLNYMFSDWKDMKVDYGSPRARL